MAKTPSITHNNDLRRAIDSLRFDIDSFSYSVSNSKNDRLNKCNIYVSVLHIGDWMIRFIPYKVTLLFHQPPTRHSDNMVTGQ